MANNGVFCLEGEWDSDLRKPESVLPILELLEGLGEIKSIHRNVSTEHSVGYYLGKWAQKRYDDYGLLYLATHGDRGVLAWSGGHQTSLEKLAAMLGDSASGRYIYMGSCLTLFDEKQTRAFVEATGVAAVMGYRKSVDWLEGAAFEVVLLSYVANHTGRPATLFRNLMAKHGELAAMFKFVLATRTETFRSQDHQR